MSTDTAFALGLLALVGPRFSERLRAFMLTVVVVDDLVALVIIATVYTATLHVVPLLAAVGFFAAVLVARRFPMRPGLICFALGAGAWVSLLKSGVEPVVIGVAMGLLAYAFPAPRSNLERATERYREFREQPTAELARLAAVELRSATSVNERLQQTFHPWTSYVIVPLFALANAGIAIDGSFLARALTSPITLGIFFGYVVGKPLGILGSSWLVTRLSRGRVQPPVGWAAVAGGGTIAGIGFTVALLVSTLAFDGGQLEEAKLGILSAALAAALLTWVLFRATARLPWPTRARALLGDTEPLVDLYVDVDPERDHIRGPAKATVTLVEYGDFECPYCGRAEQVVRELLRDFGDVRYVWRHLPLNDVHANAQLAAEAAEAAGDQGRFWDMYDLLLANQDALRPGRSAQVRRGSRARSGPLHQRPEDARGSYACRRGRRQRRPQRCVRHPDLLHQRPPPLWRLRHGHAVGRSTGGGCPGARDDDCPGKLASRLGGRSRQSGSVASGVLQTARKLRA